MERTKKISTQTLAIAILTLLLVASLVMSMTGAWFTAVDDDASNEMTFGTVSMAGLSATSIDFDLDEPNGDVVMPGDSVLINFNIQNTGTADFWARYKLVITVKDAEGDPATIGDLTVESLSADWHDSGDGWYAYKTPITGNLATAPAGQSVPVVDTYLIQTSLADTYEGYTFTVTLDVETIQVANNHGEFDPYAAYDAENVYSYAAITWPTA